MDHISPYDESLGFKISLDAAQNLKFDAFPVGLISFFPPGAFHLPLARPKTTDLYVNKSLEFNSSIKSPSWKDGYYVRLYDDIIFGISFVSNIFIFLFLYSGSEGSNSRRDFTPSSTFAGLT